MNIREISDVFKDTASGITALKSYNFGWASDRVRQGNTEDYQELNEFPRVFFSVPTITASDQMRKQDTYQVTLFFDDLLGYDNEGDEDPTLQIDKWALLQNYATAFIQRLNLIKQSILPNYLFIPEAPSFTFDSFVGIQRLVTVQVNFNLVVPTNCEVTVQRIINVVGNALASGVASGNLFRSTSVTGTATATASVFADLTVGGQNIIELFAEVFANGNVTANITRALNLNANVVTDSTVNASPIIALNLTGNCTATGDVNAFPTIIKNLTATATAEASVNAELTVTTQGVVLLEASVTATGTATGEIFRSVTLQSSSSTTAETTATATLTKVLEATATATANTDASAQLTIPVNASATATAETSANAQLSYTVNASATATAETSAEAQIVRIIIASATATAESTAEASFGVTFAANVEGTATMDNATIARAATMVASVTGQANVTGATLTTVDNVAANLNATATVTNATLDVQQPLLLDLYPNAAAAYSLRKLITAYSGSAIRVRRSSDNTEQDIGFDVNGNLDTSALTTFVGANNGFVRTWYDQSGNSRHAIQTTQNVQPQIVSSGSIFLINANPTINFVSNRFLTFNGAIVNLYAFTVSKINNNTVNLNTLLNTTFNSGDSGNIRIEGPNYYRSPHTVENFGDYTFTSGQMYFNGVIHSVLNDARNQHLLSVKRGVIATNNGLTIGRSVTLRTYDGGIQEVVLYTADQSSNRVGIETNINTHYGIY